MTIWRAIIVILIMCFGGLVGHAYDAFSPGAAKLVILGAILGATIIAAAVIDILSDRKGPPEKLLP